MTWEQYRKDADRLHLSSEATDRVLGALHAEAAKPARRTMPMWKRVAALAVCVAVAVAAVLLIPKEKPYVSFYPEDGAVAPLPVGEHLTYKEAFQLIQDAAAKGDIFFPEDALDFELLGTVGTAVQTKPAGQTVTPILGTSTPPRGDTSTNTQYANVDEADIIKAQGGFIYTLNRRDRRIKIYRANGKNTAVVATRDLPEGSRVINMYLTSDRLVVIHSTREIKYTDDGDSAFSYSQSRVYATIYDITDPSAPHYITVYGQDGTLTDSRMVNGVLYLITDHTVWSVDEENPESFVPVLYRGDVKAAVAECNLLAVPTPDAKNYAVITAVSVAGETARLAEKSVLGAGGAAVWANTSHLMLMQRGDRAFTERVAEDNPNQGITEYNDTTDLLLFDITDGKVEKLAASTVGGTPDGQFALDEHDGYFRIATTCALFQAHYEIEIKTDATGGETQKEPIHSFNRLEEVNRLYVLDASLKEVGRIDNMAPGETVRSVRFDGDIGYVVTFRQTDPLFAIDLSDPSKPAVLSALKITGFSEYLHPFGQNRLFGFGYAGTETGLSGKLKLTMFDTTDKTDVTLKTYLELPSAVYSSEALTDHHAILVDTERALVGMPTYTANGTAYVLYRYSDKDGFTQVLRCETDVPEAMRGLFIGDAFYLVTDSNVRVYDSTFTQITTA